jgi:hypothetical protein
MAASTFGGIHNFFNSGTWLVVRNLAFFFLFVVWIAVGYWVYKDARRRIEDPWLVGMAVILGLIPPFVGAFIYMLFRPPEYIEDARERQLEIKAMEQRLARRDLFCPVCRAEVDATYLVCPVCTTKLKQSCVSCKAPLEALWQICPYCETQVAAPTTLPSFEAGPTALRAPRRAQRGTE